MIGFIIGAVVGGVLGVVVMSCCAMASNTDGHRDDDQQ